MFHSIVLVFIVIGALIAFSCIALGVAYVIVASRLTRRMRKTVGEMEAILADSIEAVRVLEAQRAAEPSSVPPMRITLEPASVRPAVSVDLVDRIESWILSHGFFPTGDFEVLPHGEQLRTFLSDDRTLVAAIRMDRNGKDLYAEFCCDLGNGRRGGVGNPPLDSVQLPPDASGKYFSGRLEDDFQLLSQMWLEAKDIVDNEIVYEVRPEDIRAFFEHAHATEMDTWIACGGLSESEIRDSFEVQGIEASNDDVESIQCQWQSAVERQLASLSSKAREHLRQGSEVLVVHENCISAHLVERLSTLFQENEIHRDRDLAEILAELEILLRRFSPREAIARLRPVLPNHLRYQLIDQLTSPVGADVYRFPSSGDAC